MQKIMSVKMESGFVQICLGGRLGRSSLESRRPPQSAEPYLHLSINLSQYYTVTHVKPWYNYKSFRSSHFHLIAIFAISRPRCFYIYIQIILNNFFKLNSNPEMAVLPTFSLVSIFCPPWHCSPTAALSAHRNDPDHRFSWRSCQLQYRQLSTSTLLPITILPTSITTRPAATGPLNIKSFSHEQKSRAAPICDLMTSSR